MRKTVLKPTTSTVCWTVAIAALAGPPALAQAQTTTVRGFHLGVTLPVGQIGATMEKAVDNTAPNTLVPEPRRGMVFRDQVSGDGFAYGVGVVGGYRVPLSDGSWFLEGDAGVEWHWGETEARFAGVGTSADRRQLGESWPDRWTFARDRSYGASLRLGGSPGGLDTHGVAVYMMAGMDLAGVKFTNHYNGCLTPEPCDPSGYTSGHEDRDFDFTVWRAGVGLERSLGERAVIRAEAGYARYVREEWITPFNDVVVTVDSSIDANEVGLSLGVVRFF